jgi:acetyltransferase-like isoleucine patch superfamily enzyme
MKHALKPLLCQLRYKIGGRFSALLCVVRAGYYRLFYSIGARVNIAQGCSLTGLSIHIGNDVTLDKNTTLFGPVSLGSHIYINQQCLISSGVTIEDHVGIGYKTLIFGDSRQLTDNSHCRAGVSTMEPVLICKGAFIGARVTILPGVTIGQGAIIAAGSVVIHDCQPDTLYAGIPAKPVGESRSTLVP